MLVTARNTKNCEYRQLMLSLVVWVAGGRVGVVYSVCEADAKRLCISNGKGMPRTVNTVS